MKKIYLIPVAAIILALGLQSCGGSPEPKKEAAATETVVKETAVASEEPFAAGKKIYMEKCIVCHQATGEGIAGAFPPLKGSDYLLADKVRAVAQVLNGSNEVMVVNGNTYNAPMPPQVDTKEDAVAVINYVLNSFGNNGGTVTLEEVAGVTINPR
ncbi:MAG: c-type cytochrome [Ignavibacteria bacterium]|nr:c-type cytochrome [Ignavibacteria bacterium]